jgi:hypothetical protein
MEVINLPIKDGKTRPKTAGNGGKTMKNMFPACRGRLGRMMDDTEAAKPTRYIRPASDPALVVEYQEVEDVASAMARLPSTRQQALILSMARNPGVPVAQHCRDLGLPQSMARRWRATEPFRGLYYTVLASRASVPDMAAGIMRQAAADAAARVVELATEPIGDGRRVGYQLAAATTVLKAAGVLSEASVSVSVSVEAVLVAAARRRNDDGDGRGYG